MQDTTCQEVTMNNEPLEQVKVIKFLGVFINNTLTWNDHKQHVHSKICKNVGLIHRCRNIMDSCDSINMYKTFIQPYFLYAIEIWGHTVKSDQDILNKIQSKILRIVFNCKRSQDAWRHSNEKKLCVSNLYSSVLKNYV